MRSFFEAEMQSVSDAGMLEKARIRDIVEYERYCNDYGLTEQRRKLWFEDGIIFTTWYKGSIMKMFEARPVSREEPDEKQSVRHKVHNTVVWLNGSRAVAEMLCTLMFRTSLGGEWVDISCEARMHYRLEKRDGRWGVLYFEGIYEKDRLDPIFGDSVFNIPREKLEKYRSINWNMAARRDLYEGGLKNADDWAGSDRPETVQRIYDESSRFLWGGCEVK